MNPAVFIDRDGVLNRNVFEPSTGEPVSPHVPDELEIFSWTIESLRRLQEKEFLLFLVSNQPSYAKGITSLEYLQAVHAKFRAALEQGGIFFKEFYYCYHHPQGIVPGFSMTCACRKPGTLSLTTAQKRYDVDMTRSWMVGDRDIDVVCGQGAVVRTILIVDDGEVLAGRSGQSIPDFKVSAFSEAVDIILQEVS